MNGIRIIGIDPGLATLGVADVILTVDRVIPVCLRVFESKPPTKKRRLRVADSNADRAALQFRRLLEVIGDDKPVAFAAEAFSAPRSSHSAGKIALLVGGVIAYATEHGIPIVAGSPQELKKATAGRSSASKFEVQHFLAGKYGVSPSDVLDENDKIVAASKQEHAWDALAAVHAALESETVLAIRKMIGQQETMTCKSLAH